MVLDRRNYVVSLLEQQRFAEAEEQLRRHAATSPNDGPVHALHALCLAELDRWLEALDVARRAVAINPEDAYCHWALASVRLVSHEFRKARVSAEKAARLAPSNPDYLLVLARSHAGQSHWGEALTALEKGLALDPDHIACRHLRDLILEVRGSAAESSVELMQAVTANPLDTIAYAGRAWVALSREPRRPAARARSISEVVRHDDTSESARDGVMGALKKRSSVYRLLLRYFLWMRARSWRSQTLFVVVALTAYTLLRGTMAERPEWGPVIWSVLGVCIAFLLLKSIAEPLADRLLRMDPNRRTA
jgi:tetratricopeptide (TPR) repeat protein